MADHRRDGGLSMYGKTYFGNERTTFVIGPDSVVARVLRKVKPAEHDELVLKALAEARPAARVGVADGCLQRGVLASRGISSVAWR